VFPLFGFGVGHDRISFGCAAVAAAVDEPVDSSDQGALPRLTTEEGENGEPVEPVDEVPLSWVIADIGDISFL